MNEYATQSMSPAQEDLRPRVFDVEVPGRGAVRAYDCGPHNAPVVVGIPGTPSDGVSELVKYVGTGAVFCRLVTLDRPGYAGSRSVGERRVSDHAQVIEAILDHLAIDVASVYGVSGGGPHALATAALLPARISRVASIAGIGPNVGPGFDYTTGQVPLLRDDMLAARQGPEAHRQFLEHMVSGAQNEADPFDEVRIDNDRRITADFRNPLETLIRKQLDLPEFGEGGWIDGYVQDFQEFCSPWGFELGSIRVPTRFFHGVEDRIVPLSHSEWLQTQIPNSEVERFRNLGHTVDQLMPHVYAWLVRDLTPSHG